MEEYALAGGKIAGKVALNMAAPGAGSLVDFGEAIYNVVEGDYTSALLNVASGVFDICSLGLYGTSKAAAQETAKKSAVNAAKETVKSTKKTIGKEASKQIAKGTPKKLAAEMAKKTAKQAQKEIGKNLGKEIATGMTRDAAEEAFKQSFIKSSLQEAGMSLIGSGGKDIRKEIFETAAKSLLDEYTKTTSRSFFSSATSTAAKEGAKKIAGDYYMKTVIKDLTFHTGKGVVKYNQRQSTESS